MPSEHKAATAHLREQRAACPEARREIGDRWPQGWIEQVGELLFGANAPTDAPGFDDDAELARAVSLAQACEVAVVVLGEWQKMIGEGRPAPA